MTVEHDRNHAATLQHSPRCRRAGDQLLSQARLSSHPPCPALLQTSTCSLSMTQYIFHWLSTSDVASAWFAALRMRLALIQPGMKGNRWMLLLHRLPFFSGVMPSPITGQSICVCFDVKTFVPSRLCCYSGTEGGCSNIIEDQPRNVPHLALPG